jgi:hypothetical protein
MSEWWTYRPSDLLMFAPRTYWRLFELHNEAWWPLQPLAVLAGLAWLVWRWRRVTSAPGGGTVELRVGAAALAIASAFVGWSFVLQRYAPINSVAPALAIGFFAQGLALATLAMRRDLNAGHSALRVRVGMLLVGFALLGQPLLAPAVGRPWAQTEVIALAPDPTAIATLGVLLSCGATRPPTRGLLRLLWVLAVLQCAVSAATLLTMGSPQGWVPIGAAVLAVIAALARR